VWSVEENADHGMLRYRNTGNGGEYIRRPPYCQTESYLHSLRHKNCFYNNIPSNPFTNLTIYNWTDIAHINEIKFNTMNTERMV